MQLYEKLVNSAMQMDVFSQLTEKITAQEYLGVLQNEVVDAAKKAGFTRFEKRTELLCSGTQDIDIIRK